MKRLGGLLASALVAGAISVAATSATARPSGRLVLTGGCGTICLVRPDGGAATAITEPFAQYPVFSPDQKHIAFESQSGLVVTDARGKHAHTVLTHWAVSHPSWSPDGKWIAFTGDRTTYDSLLWVVSSHGGTPRPLPGPVHGVHFASEATWSPNGREIAFLSYEPGHQAEAGIYVVRPNGKGWHRISRPSLSGEQDPAWSPNGRWLVFSRLSTNWTKDFTAVLVRARADGSGEHVLTSGGFWDAIPVVSPDGRFIAFARHRGRTGVSTTFIVPSLGGKLRPVPGTTGVPWDWIR